MTNRKRAKIFGLIGLLVAIIIAGWFIGGYFFRQRAEAGVRFNGDQAYQDVVYQLSLGDRVPGSPGHAAIVAWMKAQLEDAGWQTEVQESTQMGHPVQNVIAKRGQGQPWIILGAHYDTRMWASRDPDPAKQQQPVPGADDGASGVAVLLGLARVLPKVLNEQVWLVFFDAEDNGNIPGWDWSLGANAFADSLTVKPDAVVVVDMVGDKNLNINLEENSNPQINTEIWATAAQLGYSQFIPLPKYSIIDDHTPFLQKGIAAIDIIDIDYPYWHTTQDTADKVSGASMEAVGETLRVWIVSKERK